MTHLGLLDSLFACAVCDVSMYVTHTSFIIVPKLHSYSAKHALFRVPSIPTLALANSSQDLICTRVLDSSSCGPWQFRPSPPCKRVMTRLGPFTLVPMWSGRLCLPGKSFRGFPFCSRCGKTRSGHENKNVTHTEIHTCAHTYEEQHEKL